VRGLNQKKIEDREDRKFAEIIFQIHISLLHEQPNRANKFVVTGGKSLYIKSLLFVALSIFMLAGCGYNQNDAIGTQDEPSNETREALPADDSTNEGTGEKDKTAPLEGEDSPMTEGEQSDMPDVKNPDTDENEINN